MINGLVLHATVEESASIQGVKMDVYTFRGSNSDIFNHAFLFSGVSSYFLSVQVLSINSLTTIKQTTKEIVVCKFSKNVMSKLYHIENSKPRGQTVKI